MGILILKSGTIVNKKVGTELYNKPYGRDCKTDERIAGAIRLGEKGKQVLNVAMAIKPAERRFYGHRL